MKSEQEIRQAMVVLATALQDGDVSRFTWGSLYPARERAWMALSALSWVMDVKDTTFAGVLEHVKEKVEKYSEKLHNREQVNADAD